MMRRADSVESPAESPRGCSGLRRRASARLAAAADAANEKRQPGSPGRQLQHWRTRRSARGSGSPSPPQSAGSLTPPPTPRSPEPPLPSWQLHSGASSCSSGSPQPMAALPAAVQLAAAAEPLLTPAAEAAVAPRPARRPRKQQQRRRHKGVALMVLQLAATAWLALCAAALCVWLAATL